MGRTGRHRRPVLARARQAVRRGADSSVRRAPVPPALPGATGPPTAARTGAAEVEQRRCARRGRG
ncbi:hypothetical protein [Amycolatopsis sp. cmx-4-68]|uniref:hypothetical protein n=1 Tax=Amycolatopsis sp. cmx-4-68 TaxID=2790938 RepID=UPI00397A5112